MGKIKVGLSALHYPVTMARFFWDALDRRNDVETFAVGPFFGDYIPWGGGMRLPQKYVKVPHVCLPQASAQYHTPYGMVAGSMPDDLDLFLTIDAGWHFSTRPTAKVNVLIKTDPHCVSSQHYSVPKGYSDITFCMQQPYRESGDLYLAYAFDPTIHYPMPEVRKNFDACLIGLQYEHRVKLIDALRKANISVKSGIGIVYDDYRLAYNQSRIALSWSSLLDTPTRVYEAMAMGIPLVSNRTPDLCSQFVDGRHFLGFDDVSEAIHQVKHILGSEDRGQMLAQAAYDEVQKYHSWDHRITQILETAGLI
jgi:glycosyltransferase involved in cell wall biosynthesis